MAFSFPSWGKWSPESHRIRPAKPGAARFPLGSHSQASEQPCTGAVRTVTVIQRARQYSCPEQRRAGIPAGSCWRTRRWARRVRGSSCSLQKNPPGFSNTTVFPHLTHVAARLQKKLDLIKIIQYCESFSVDHGHFENVSFGSRQVTCCSCFNRHLFWSELCSHKQPSTVTPAVTKRCWHVSNCLSSRM